MAIRVSVFVCLVMTLAVGVRPCQGDIVVRVEEKDSSPKADAAASPAEARTVLSVETSAGASGRFAAKMTAAGETVELAGDVKKSEGGPYRVRVTFVNTGPHGTQEVSTNITLPLNKPTQISGLDGPGVHRSIVLTLEESAAAPAPAPAPAK